MKKWHISNIYIGLVWLCWLNLLNEKKNVSITDVGLVWFFLKKNDKKKRENNREKMNFQNKRMKNEIIKKKCVKEV